MRIKQLTPISELVSAHHVYFEGVNKNWFYWSSENENRESSGFRSFILTVLQ